MSAFAALLIYLAVTLLLAYLGERFNWRMLEPASAPYWPVLIPIMIIGGAFFGACSLGERHRKKKERRS